MIYDGNYTNMKKLNEESYVGNLGAIEMFKFYQIASDIEIEEMEKIAKNKNWVAFKKLIKKVLGVELK